MSKVSKVKSCEVPHSIMVGAGFVFLNISLLSCYPVEK